MHRAGKPIVGWATIGIPPANGFYVRNVFYIQYFHAAIINSNISQIIFNNDIFVGLWVANLQLVFVSVRPRPVFFFFGIDDA